MKLAGTIALITGGRRIGAQLAMQLAERGCHLALSYHSRQDIAESIAESCRRLGVRAATYPADLTQADQARRLVESVVADFGRLDVLVNLTSVYRRTPFDSLTDRDYEDMISSNLTAPYWVAVAAAKQMRRQPIVEGLQGKIIHFADWSVDRPYRDFLPYLVGKGAIVTLTKALAVELAPTITVNAIAPGTVLPPPDLSDEQRERIRQSTALERIGSPDDVNRAVLYLLEGTDFVTGEVYRVDGGRFLGHPETSQADLDG